MIKVFGEFIEEFLPHGDFLELSFMTSSPPNPRSWRNNRLSTYFVADYFSNLLTIDPDPEERIQEIKNILSYIGNELLENAIKFNDDSKNSQVKLGIYVRENTDVKIIMYAKNSIYLEKVHKYQAWINLLLTEDPNELYIQQIETTSVEEDSEASGLGLLTLINDYSAKLGWKFTSESSQTEIITVTTMAQVVV
ncbi:MAG: ATP-binding protein [Nostocales cyanobacterium ELA583]|jgi:hypothetical protein